MPIPCDKKSDHLILLIGTNPLPNYVAAQLLSKTDTKLYFVVTDEMLEIGIPQRLLKLLKKDPSDQSQYIPVNSSSPVDVYVAIYGLITNNPQKGCWGLNYTGGKKVMATHAYRGMEHALAKIGKAEQAVYSYLDADAMEMILEDSQGQSKYGVQLDVRVTIEQILEIHGREIQGKIKEKPFQPDFGAKLIEYCQNKEHREYWLNWASEHLKRPNGRDLNNTLARTVQIPADIPEIGGKKISEIELNWKIKAEDIAKWLHGQWLDDYVWQQALLAAPNCQVQQVVSSLRPIGVVEFEVDVVAMQGYRLFAISATTEDEKGGLAKLKLFEARERARQMGGDEARVALVTFSENPNKLEQQTAEQLKFTKNEKQQNWKSPVRVWGIRQLRQLASHLEEWFKEV